MATNGPPSGPVISDEFCSQPAGTPVCTTQNRRLWLTPAGAGRAWVFGNGPGAVAVAVGDAGVGTDAGRPALSARCVPSYRVRVTPASPPTAEVVRRLPPTLTVITALLPVAGGTTCGATACALARGGVGVVLAVLVDDELPVEDLIDDPLVLGAVEDVEGFADVVAGSDEVVAGSDDVVTGSDARGPGVRRGSGSSRG